MLPINTKVQVKGIVNSKPHTVRPFHLIIQNHNTINYILIGISIVLVISLIVATIYILKYIKLRQSINAK